MPYDLDESQGLSHIHSRRIVHRDLKPHNILVRIDPYPQLKIADFGIAEAIQPGLRQLPGGDLVSWVVPFRYRSKSLSL